MSEHVPHTLGVFHSELERRFNDGALRGFPAFLVDPERCTPTNSAPYVISLRQLLASLATSCRRRELAEHFTRQIGALLALGVRPVCGMIGGSFLRDGTNPRDLDCALFYVLPSRTNSGDLAQWQSESKELGIDVRLIPYDVDPCLVLKSALFLGALYALDKQTKQSAHGVVLVDLSELRA